ncbi:hypothetical protein [Subtercola sp. RTI3]|uniref:hypothetical protein n=1 Tax=Subtercola sp. RTI3 TaxID=3048639 RepID=UPI002B239C31|nr:hypothetical protein [Subtercola sp. RTI3]MEA9985673.1 hypothetical protein [Subtercola sp. RTI3]
MNASTKLDKELRKIVKQARSVERWRTEGEIVLTMKRAIDKYVIGGDAVYEPGNPLTLTLPKRRRDDIEDENALKAKQRQFLWGTSND